MHHVNPSPFLTPPFDTLPRQRNHDEGLARILEYGPDPLKDVKHTCKGANPCAITVSARQ